MKNKQYKPGTGPVSRIIAAAFILLIIAWPFLHIGKFPWTMPLLALLLTVLFLLPGWGLKAAGWNFSGKPGSVVRTILLAFLVTELSFDLVLQPFVSWLFDEPADYSVFDRLQGNTALLAKYILYTWLSAALAEELIYRGALTSLLLRTGLPANLALVAQALLFASAHFYQGWSGMAITFLFGLAFGIIYRWSGKQVYIVVLVHGLIDSLFLLLAYTGHLNWYADPFSILFT